MVTIKTARCPYCESPMEYKATLQDDLWTNATLDCAGQASLPCGITIDFGMYGPGISQREIVESIEKLLNNKL